MPGQQEKALSLYFSGQRGLCGLDSPATEPGSWSPGDKPKNREGLEEEKPLNTCWSLFPFGTLSELEKEHLKKTASLYSMWSVSMPRPAPALSPAWEATGASSSPLLPAAAHPAALPALGSAPHPFCGSQLGMVLLKAVVSICFVKRTHSPTTDRFPWLRQSVFPGIGVWSLGNGVSPQVLWGHALGTCLGQDWGLRAVLG